jgi:hypothetical protein
MPFDLITLDPNHYYSYFQFAEYDYLTSTTIDYAYGALTTNRLTVSRLSAIPLPASLGMMVIALGGLALFRRRRETMSA